ncbi:MAG: hypothetical protein AAFN27_12580 [Pseudomonadota bacterium]
MFQIYELWRLISEAAQKVDGTLSIRSAVFSRMAKKGGAFPAIDFTKDHRADTYACPGGQFLKLYWRDIKRPKPEFGIHRNAVTAANIRVLHYQLHSLRIGWVLHPALDHRKT